MFESRDAGIHNAWCMAQRISALLPRWVEPLAGPAFWRLTVSNEGAVQRSMFFLWR